MSDYISRDAVLNSRLVWCGARMDDSQEGG